MSRAPLRVPSAVINLACACGKTSSIVVAGGRELVYCSGCGERYRVWIMVRKA